MEGNSALKEQFETPELELIELDEGDIITESCPSETELSCPPFHPIGG